MILRKLSLLIYLGIFTFTLNTLAAEINGDSEQRRWNKPGIPHAGWEHDGVEDLGIADGICQMCDKTGIRFIHTLSHDEHKNIEVGCVCAEKMCNDYINPKARERSAKNEAARLRKAQKRATEIRFQREQSWLDLEQWLKKDNGTYSKILGHQWVNIFFKNRVWKYVFNNEFSQGFSTAEKARQEFYSKYRNQILRKFLTISPTGRQDRNELVCPIIALLG